MVQIKTILNMLTAVMCRAKKVDHERREGRQQEQANTTEDLAKTEPMTEL